MNTRFCYGEMNLFHLESNNLISFLNNGGDVVSWMAQIYLKTELRFQSLVDLSQKSFNPVMHTIQMENLTYLLSL